MSSAGQHRVAGFWSQFIHDPVKFFATFWPHYDLAQYQVDILRSVSTNTETWVHSAHGMGKSFVASAAALWWFATRKSKIFVISAGEGQLRTAMWGEIEKLLQTATYQGKPFDFGFLKRDLKLLYPGDGDLADPQYFLWLRAVGSGEQIHGAHLPLIDMPGGHEDIGTVFWIFEEGSGIPDHYFDIAAASRHRMLVVGNPTRDHCAYANNCKSGDRHLANGRLFRKVIKISALDSPNVKFGLMWEASGRPGPPPKVFAGKKRYVPGILTFDEYKLRLETYTEAEKKTRLFGEFPSDEGQSMFPLSWLDTAQQLGKLLLQRQEAMSRENPKRAKVALGPPFGLGIDVSQGGGDLSAWVVWGRFGVVEVLAKETPNTTEIAGTTIQLMRKWRIDPAWVAFDAGGGGKQIADTLRDRGYENILDIDFGGSADDKKKYKNKRSELYGELREAMQPNAMTAHILTTPPEKWGRRWGSKKLECAALPPGCAELRDDLRVLPLLRDGEGRLRMLPKDKQSNRAGAGNEKSLRQLLGRSPDRGDACALAYYAWKAGQEFKSLEYIDGDLVY